MLMKGNGRMIRYEAFVTITENGSFTKTAEKLGYTQSAVSQMIRSLEEELDTSLIIRSRKGVSLTPDGEEFLPYIKNVYNAHRELIEKRNEMTGLESGLIRIGTFSSVSSNWLPRLMKEFKEKYPSVSFDLKQGEYTNISDWIKEGSVDFGFVTPGAAEGLTVIPLKNDDMMAVLNMNHPLAQKGTVSLDELAKESYILLDEGEVSEPMEYFKKNGIIPNIQYTVFDDYTIMSMVENNLGVSVLPNLVLSKHAHNIVIKKLSHKLERTIALAYKNKNVLPIASRFFVDFIIDKKDGFLGE